MKILKFIFFQILIICSVFMGNVKSQYANDVGTFSIAERDTQYYFYQTTIIPMRGVVKNYGTNTNSFTVTRRITPGTYVSTKNVTALPGNSTDTITFDDFINFTSGTTYTIKDSTYLYGDENPSNDTMRVLFIPKVVKANLIFWKDAASRDSLKLALDSLEYSYDILQMDVYTGTLRYWKTVWALFGNGDHWTDAIRDSIKSFLDYPSALGKNTLIIFGNDLGYHHDRPGSPYTTEADSVFYRYYLKAHYLANNWYDLFLSSNQLIKGIYPDYKDIDSMPTNDKSPDCVIPINGGNTAFYPEFEVTSDTAVGVYYNGVYIVQYYTNILTNYTVGEKVKSNKLGILGYIIIIIIILIITTQEAGGELPIELITFLSLISGQNVTLNWATTKELNNSGFEVQRLYQEIQNPDWINLGFVKGNGTTNTPTNYTFTDNSLNTGKYKYRLKQIDFNGNFKYYDLNSIVEIGAPLKFSLSQNYPNPFNPHTTIKYGLPKMDFVNLKIFDVLGREIATLVNEKQSPGYYSVDWDGSAFSSGVYFYRLYTGVLTDTKRMVLIK